MQKIELLQEGNCYHIYNRGINRDNIFHTPSDYKTFMDRFKKYTVDVLDIFSYSLLPNHFHCLVHVKKGVFVKRSDGNGTMKLVASRQLGHLFNSYAQSFNKDYNRVGGLFQKPFKRKLVESEEYLRSLVMYIHNNPRRHGIVDDFTKWSYSSYHDLLSDDFTFLRREIVMEWFGGKEQFIQLHQDYSARKNELDENWVLE